MLAGRVDPAGARNVPPVLELLVNLSCADPHVIAGWLTNGSADWSPGSALAGLEAELNNRDEKVREKSLGAMECSKSRPTREGGSMFRCCFLHLFLWGKGRKPRSIIERSLLFFLFLFCERPDATRFDDDRDLPSLRTCNDFSKLHSGGLAAVLVGRTVGDVFRSRLT